MPTKSKNIIIFTDGGARGNPGPAAIGVHAEDAQGTTLYEYSATIGKQTNNEAEYRAVISSLEWLLEYLSSTPVSRVEWKLDSNLVVQQVQGNWKIKAEHIAHLNSQIQKYLTALPCEFKFTHIPRSQNARADALVNMALDAKKY